MLAIFPEIQKLIKEKDLEHLALLVRKYYCQPKPFHPVVDARNLLTQVGIQLSIVDIPDYAALVVKDENGAFTVHALVSPKADASSEASFLYAHLLGHYLLHVQPQIVSGDFHKGGFKEKHSPLQYSADKRKKQDKDLSRELEANAFAAALLVPLAMLSKAKAKLESVDKLAQFFDVSPAFVKQRLKDMDIPAAPAAAPEPQNFTEAEKLLEKARSEKMFSDTQTPKPKMPRSFAASSYGKTEKQTAPAPTQGTAAKPEPTAEQVMTRLRNLAKKIDSSVETK